MNEFLLLVYLAELSEKMDILFQMSIVSFMLYAVFGAMFLLEIFDDDKKFKIKEVLGFAIKLSTAIAILSFLYPSKNTLYIAASAKAGQIGIEKMQGSDTFDKALKLLDKKLDEALAEEKNGR